MKIIAVSDLHFDAVTAGVARFDEVARSFRAAVARACEWADLFIFAGDAADPNSGAGTIRAIDELVRAALVLSQRNIPSVWLTGNHDVVEDDRHTSVLTPLKSITKVYDRVQGRKGALAVFDEPGTQVFFDGTTPLCTLVALPFTSARLPYDPAKFLEETISLSCPRPLIVVSHLTKLEGAPLGSESSVMARGRGVPLPLNVLAQLEPDLVLQGHFHIPGVVRAGNMNIHVIGSPEAFTFGEAGQRAKWLEVEVG